MSTLHTISRQIIDNLILQMRQEDNKIRLQQFIVDPTIKYILDKLFPYLVGGMIVLILVIILTVIMIALIVYDMRIRHTLR